MYNVTLNLLKKLVCFRYILIHKNQIVFSIATKLPFYSKKNCYFFELAIEVMFEEKFDFERCNFVLAGENFKFYFVM